VQRQLIDAGAVASVVAQQLGMLDGADADGEALEVDTTVEAMPSVLWDAMVVPSGEQALPALVADGRVVEFVKDQYRHCKPILVLGNDTMLLEAAGVAREVIERGDDPGLIVAGDGEDDDAGGGGAVQRFVQALARHRHYERELDPPMV
jgi:catalase